MRILQVTPAFSPKFGGSVTVVQMVSKELAKHHDVTVYTTSALDQRHDSNKRPFQVETDGYHIVYFPRILKFTGFSISPIMARELGASLNQFDIVHLHSWRHFQETLIHHYAGKYRVPYVLQTHGSIPRIMAKKNLKWFYDVLSGGRVLRDASKVIALNQLEVQQYGNMGVPKDKIAIIPNGIDLSEYSNLPTKGCFKKKYNINDDEKIVLFLGRIHKIKGIDILVRAFARVVEKSEGVRLVIVGPNDGYLREVKTLARALKIDDSVVLTGPLYGRQKLEAYVDADVCTLPSRYEIWGMTVLEAYACGKPVIASKIGGLMELVTNGTTGLLFEVGNVSQMANSMSCLLSDTETAREMGLAGKRFLEENYTVQKVVRRLEELYERLQRDKLQA